MRSLLWRYGAILLFLCPCFILMPLGVTPLKKSAPLPHRASLATQLWGMALKCFYLWGRKPMLFSFQAALPSLPVPPLRSTIDEFLSSVEPILSVQTCLLCGCMILTPPLLGPPLILKSWSKVPRNSRLAMGPCFSGICISRLWPIRTMFQTGQCLAVAKLEPFKEQTDQTEKEQQKQDENRKRNTGNGNKTTIKKKWKD